MAKLIGFFFAKKVSRDFRLTTTAVPCRPSAPVFTIQFPALLSILSNCHFNYRLRRITFSVLRTISACSQKRTASGSIVFWKKRKKIKAKKNNDECTASQTRDNLISNRSIMYFQTGNEKD